MKKLMTILVVFALCGVAMAQTVDPNAPVSLTKKTTTEMVTEHVNGYWARNSKTPESEKQYRTGEKKQEGGHTYYYIAEHDVTVPKTVNVAQPYYNVKKDGTLGDSGLTYTVTDSTSKGMVNGYYRQEAQVFFTTASTGPEGKVLAVQFLGAELETKDTAGNVYPGTVTDYGIYLCDSTTGNRIGDYLKASEYGNYFSLEEGIKPNTSFGVFYIDGEGNYIASTGDGGKYVGETFDAKENGIVGNYDKDSHNLTVYNENTNQPDTVKTDRHFLCLSAGEYGKNSFKYNHFEFMLQTTWDDPYYHVNPNDFLDEEHQVHIDDPVVHPNGQPLPGTLATLLIGGLCAKALSKKNKKH